MRRFCSSNFFCFLFVCFLSFLACHISVAKIKSLAQHTISLLLSFSVTFLLFSFFQLPFSCPLWFSVFLHSFLVSFFFLSMFSSFRYFLSFSVLSSSTTFLSSLSLFLLFFFFLCFVFIFFSLSFYFFYSFFLLSLLHTFSPFSSIFMFFSFFSF